MTVAGSRLSSAFSYRTLQDIQLRLLHHALALRVEIVDRLKFGDIASRVTNDVVAIRTLLADNLLHTFRDAFALVIGLGVMMWLDFRLALATTPGLVLVYLLSQAMSNRLKKKVKSLQQNIGLFLSSIVDPLFNLIAVKAYTLEDFVLAKVRRLVGAYTAERISLDMLNTSASQMVFFLTSLGTVMVLWYGGSKAMEGSLSLGKLVAFSFLFSQLAATAQRLSSFHLQFKAALASLERLSELRAMPVEPIQPRDNGRAGFKASIEFHDVWFSYPDGRQAIRGLTFSVQPGETVALVGPNGAGKSTVVKLLLKLYEIQEGDIFIAEKNIKAWSPFELRSLISLVPQEDYLFPVSLGENIQIGRPEATMEEVLEAAGAAGAHDFIAKLPDGYNTLLGERGINLSGGERQRISLARAFLKNSPILLLDEGVSQIDSQSDAMIRETIHRLFHGRTVVVVAHRLWTVLRADRIIVLNGGKVEAVGKHHELYPDCELYRQLCESQLLRVPDVNADAEAWR